MKETTSGSWFANLNLKPKMLYGIGAIMAMFVIVIGIYQFSLSTTATGFNELLDHELGIMEHATNIDVQMLQARRNEKDFMLRKDKKYPPANAKNVEMIISEAGDLKEIAKMAGYPEYMKAADEIIKDAKIYSENFQELAKAEEIKGLDHESGAQGTFRAFAAKLMDAASEHELTSMTIDMLQMRRYEKDYNRTKSSKYKKSWQRAMADFERRLKPAKIDAEAKGYMEKGLSAYGRAANRFLASSSDADYEAIRSAAGDIEKAINDVLVPDISAMTLMLRRHEKDYLLRGTEK
ncbi:MAG: hypothetical protein KAS94_15035, partial [Desulfobulbaceae bacterium]|nr:hypothetical protein [Desulfobulbaceae bacterium]